MRLDEELQQFSFSRTDFDLHDPENSSVLFGNSDMGLFKVVLTER
ncbi:hypothetical protein [Bradyrhizobium sp. 142]|nr:hypothetical protein [Bradyrhizobium sp. 142]